MYTIKQETIALEKARNTIIEHSINEALKYILIYKLQERKNNQEIVGTFVFKEDRPYFLLEINFKDKEK